MLMVVSGNVPVSSIHVRRNRAFRVLAEAADYFHIPLLFTKPTMCDSFQDGISGWEIDTSMPPGNTEMWKSTRQTTELQELVAYDAMFLSDLMEHRKCYKKLMRNLKRDQIRCFNPVLPSKDKVYQEIEKRDLYCGKLPTTLYDINVDCVLEILGSQTNVWLKPIYGSGGRNILRIERTGALKYVVSGERFNDGVLKKEFGHKELRAFLQSVLQERRYLAQEHVDLLQTAEGRRFDFRVTVQRNETGAWETVAVTERIGAPGAFLTNFHAGATVESVTNLTAHKRHRLKKVSCFESDLWDMKACAIAAANILEHAHPNLAIIGVDIGKSESGELFAYDFNGRPGRDILSDEEVAVSMRKVAGFARYLLDETD